MANKNILNSFNENIRQQGGLGPWVSDINNEIYQNIDQIEGQSNNQQGQINNILNNELPSKQNVINDHDQRLQNQQNQVNQILNSELPSKQNQINDHENRLQNQQNFINNINNDLAQKQNQITQILNSEIPSQNSRLNECQNKINLHDEKIIEFDKKIKDFNQDALNVLGKHFLENHKVLNDTTKNWLAATVILFSIIIIADYFLPAKSLDDLYSFVPRNLVFFALLYFFVIQYSQYKKLAMDYKNRDVVARSYLGILNNSQGEERSTITAIVADTLFSRNVIDQSGELPVKEAVRIGEKMLDASAGIAKNR